MEISWISHGIPPNFSSGNPESFKTTKKIPVLGPVPQNGPQFATKATFHQHVKVFGVFECAEQFDHKVAVGLLHDLLLGHDVLLLPRLHNLTLFHLLEGVRSARIVADLHQFHPTEAAHSQRRDDTQLVELDVGKAVVDPVTRCKFSKIIP